MTTVVPYIYQMLPASTESRDRLTRLLPLLMLVFTLSPLLACRSEYATIMPGEPVTSSEYATIVSREPAASSEFDVYLHDGKLSYAKEPCVEGDTRKPFFLHLLPADVNDLPEWSSQRGYENRDFNFTDHGAVFEGKCMATVPLPDYTIGSIRTGQYVPDEGGRSWQVDFAVAYSSEYATIVSGEPAASSEFDVYLHDGKLSYAKEPCVEGDTRKPFFLHLLPADVNDLPEWSSQRGYENRDFNFTDHGAVFEGKCMATVPLPDYTIGSIRTGQYVPDEGGRSWQVDFAVAYSSEYATIVSGEPAASSEFDVYLHDGKLSYAKEPCVEGDTRKPFFLHLLPADVNDLPEWSSQRGYENRDFNFTDHGAVFEGKCMATVPLPDYTIGSIRTGQYVPDEGGRSWQVDFARISFGDRLKLILKAIFRRLG